MSTAETTPSTAQVVQLIQKLFPGTQNLRPTDPLLEGIVDSLGIFTLVQALESQFGIQVPETEMVTENFKSAATLGSAVDRMLKKG